MQSTNDTNRLIDAFDAADTLMRHPEFSSRPEFDLKELSPDIPMPQWFRLLAAQPQFAEYFDWSRVRPTWASWAELLSAQPQFAERCHWEQVSRLDLVEMHFLCPDILRQRFPDGDFRALLPFLTNLEKSILLSDIPQAETLFDWHKLTNELSVLSWMTLLSRQPQFEIHFDWSRVEKKYHHDWAYLLIRQPQFASHCDFSLLDQRQIGKILRHQPALAHLCNPSKQPPSSPS